MATYNYTRTIVNGVYDIPNYNDVDSKGNRVSLSKRIKESIIAKDTKISMVGTSVDIEFPGYTLTTGEELELSLIHI